MSDRTLVFVRDDDVGDASPGFESVGRLLVELAVPVSYQVVPKFLTPAGVELARELAESASAPIAFHQHGLCHEQELDGVMAWTEFAGGRPYADQLADIQEGQRILTEQLGPLFERTVFTPPSHRYDRATLSALAASGVTVVSAGVYHGWRERMVYAAARRLGRVTVRGRPVSYHLSETPQPGLVEVSTSVNIDMDRLGERRNPSAAELLAEFEAARRATPAIGLLLHHETYESSDRLDNLRQFLEALLTDGRVVFVPLTDVAAGVVPAAAAA